MSETYGEEEESILQTAKLWQENVSAIIGPLETCLHEVNILILISMSLLIIHSGKDGWKF